jgi:hypothetical protein
MSIKNYLQGIAIALLPIIAGCAGSISINKFQTDMEIVKEAYIIKNTHSYSVTGYNKFFKGNKYDPRKYDTVDCFGNTFEVIKSSLEKNGIEVISGYGTDIPQTTNIIVKYEDYWQWDFVQYLKYFHIAFVNPKTNKVIIESEFFANQFGYHDFPTSEKKVPKIITSLTQSISRDKK